MTLDVAVVLHLTLDPGTTEAESDRLWRECFQPLIGAIHHTPDVKLGLVLAGELVEDLQERHVEGIEWTRALVERHQVELVGTALHEPVLSAVPERDAIGQIAAHATLLKKVFNVRPTGAWLPHGIWDPSVPRILRQADMAWTLIDDGQVAAMTDGGPGGVWRAEREGYGIALLAADSHLREVGPDTPIKQVLGHVEARARRGDGLATIAIDANRFASRRDQSWLATLLAGLGRMEGVRCLRPSDAVVTAPSRGRIYLPSGAPSGQTVPWERCLLRYEEANRLHKRMMRASRLVERLERMVKEGGPGGWKPDPSQLVQAHRYLYRSQSALVYTHGPHAGIYDAPLRALAWKDVLRAERVATDAMRLDERMSVETTDLDCDGNDDVVLRTPGAIAVIDRAHSGGLIELSIPGMGRNLLDTLTRQREPYHAQLPAPQDVPEEAETDAGLMVDDDEPTMSGIEPRPSSRIQQELSRALAHDRRPRVCFVEHLIGPEVTLRDLMRGSYQEIGRGLREAPWTLVTAERHGDGAVRALVYGEGTVDDFPLVAGEAPPPDGGGEKLVRMDKRYTLHRDPMLDFRLEVSNRGHEVLRARLALELDLALAVGGELPVLVVGQERRSTTAEGDCGDVQDFRLEAGDATVHVALRKPARLWHYPIETVHQDGGTLVRGHQGVCIVLVWPVELWGQEKTRFDVRLAVES